MLSNETISKLQKLTKESNAEKAALKTIDEFIDLKLFYLNTINQKFETKHGMSFLDYQNTKYEEWDGDDWTKKDEFMDWESVIAMIEHYTDLRNEWTYTNLKQN